MLTAAQEYFFTISAAGVTLYDHGVTEFTPLKQWHREYYLFNEIMRVRTFKVYRIWKTFRMVGPARCASHGLRAWFLFVHTMTSLCAARSTVA